MAGEQEDGRPWYRRWDGQPSWWASRQRSDRAQARARRWIRLLPILSPIGVSFSILGVVLGQPSLVVSGLTPLIMQLAIPREHPDDSTPPPADELHPPR